MVPPNLLLHAAQSVFLRNLTATERIEHNVLWLSLAGQVVIAENALRHSIFLSRPPLKANAHLPNPLRRSE